ncbi:MAG: hypothetical protein ACLQLE_11925, partial [Desulfobaccales bacterium]
MPDSAIITLRLLLWKLLLFWNYFLNCLASKYVLKIKSCESWKWEGLKNFEEKSKPLQTDLYGTFLPHSHLCNECKGRCCKGPALRFYAIDYLVLGGPNDRAVRMSQFSLLYMLNRFRHYIGPIMDVKNKKTIERKAEDLVFQENRNPNCCPELSDSGCRLPLGRRSN